MKFRYGSPLTNPSLVEAFETSRGIRLPEAYKAMVREHDGAHLQPSLAIVWNPPAEEFERIGCDSLVPFSESEDGENTMDELNRNGHPVVPEGIIVFGMEAGGFMFGFDYRSRNQRKLSNPPVVLIYRDNEEEHYVLPVADNFQAFIRGLEATTISPMMKFEGGCHLTNPSLIETFESSRGIRLPEAYKAIVREHDGAYLEPAIAQVWNPELDQSEEIGCDIFVPFEDRGGGGYIMDELNRDGHPVVPDGIIVFGKEGGGYLFGFDYRTNRKTDNPPVVLIHRDNSEPDNYVLPVADTFDAFLAALESRPRPTK